MEPAAPIIDRFEVEGRVAEGGMGAVYRGRDRASGAIVALKVLHRAHDDDLARFAREAAMLDELRHPGIVRYIGRGVAEDGRHYLVLEWLEGEDLARRLSTRGLTGKDSVLVAQQAAEALAAAHARGIVHRDIKPSNLFLTGGDVSKLKVLDFGIARFGGPVSRVTATGVLVGTPGYMSPEQARGEHDVGPAADVFSLGCVLFECLTGTPAFRGEQAGPVLVKVLTETPARVRETLTAVPHALDELVAQMLAMDPDARPRDARVVAEALRAIGDLPSVLAVHAPRRAGALTGSELRLVTVVFASTRAEGLPNLDATIDTAHAPARELVEALHARLGLSEDRLLVERLADGSLLATLTERGAATDQVALAARCALALRELIPEARLVVATGRAMLRGRLPEGDVTDRARSLFAASAGGDGVALDETTAGLLDARFDVDATDGRFVLRAERALGTHSRTLLGRQMPCVGREHEIAAVLTAYNRCVDEPRAVAVLVTAPPGVGKSRLRHEVVNVIRRQSTRAAVWLGAADALNAGSRFGILAHAVRRAAGVLDGEPAAEQQRKLRARVGRFVPEADLSRVTEFVGELCGVRFPDSQSPQLRHAREDALVMADQMRDAWIDWLRAECAQHPLVLVLEELHWGDVSTARFVDDALRELGDRPLFVVGLARPEVEQVLPGLWSERTLQHLRLGPLPRRAAESLVRAALGANVPAGTVDLLVERAAGNAFYLEEMIRAAADGKVDALPPTVVAMLQTRIDSFEEGARRVLRAASIFGGSFARGGVRALLGGSIAPTQVDAWLRLLVTREVLAPRGRERYVDDAEYSFRHALVREAAYGMLTPEDRALGHRLAGRWLEQAGDADATLLAGHFEQGGEPERALGWYRAAAEQALDGNDLAGAISRAERGVVCGARGPALGALRLVQTEACSWSADFPRALQFAKEALSLVPPGATSWFRAAGHVVVVSGFLGDIAPVVDLLGPLQASEPGDDAIVPYSHVTAHVFIMLGMLGLMDQANALFQRLERFAGPVEESNAVVGGTLCHARVFANMWSGWDPWESRRLCELGIMRLLSVRHVRSAAQLGVLLVHAHMEQGELEKAEATARRWMDRIAPLENRLLTACVDQALGAVLTQAGKFDEALRVLNAAVESFVAQSNPVLEADTRAYVARALLAAGDREGAVREGRLADERIAFPGYLRIHALAALGLALAASGDGPGALAAAREASTLLASYGGSCRGAALARLALAEALLACGDDAGSREAVVAASDALRRLSERAPNGRSSEVFVTGIIENARTRDLAARHAGGVT
jgi:tetratricopeptide (TPR) repeat protein